ncbi:hypothetical protein LSE82_005718 [Salmonella enterica]|nr:hypothetical protein [Salmonella enterica]EIP3426788.1 hypothetical protein [Salmonella enterica]
MSEQNKKLIIVHQIVRVEFSEVVEVPAGFSHNDVSRLPGDFWNVADRSKAMTAPELVEPGGQYIERIAPEDNSSGRYKPDLSVTKGPSGELIYRRLSDDGMPVTAG